MPETELATVYLFVGALTYLLLPLSDVAAQRGKRVLGHLIFSSGSAILGLSLLQILRLSDRWPLPGFVRILGAVLSAGFLGLLLYSLFVEVRRGGGALITTGTYALVRHPGVLWWLLFLGSMLIATGSKVLVAAMPVWVTMDFFYVLVQERFFFNRVFGEAYSEYRGSVPMVLPTRASARSFFSVVGTRGRSH